MLRDLNLGEMKSGVPVLAVSLALEGKASHREMTSKLLSDLCGTVMSTNDVEKSFDKLLKDLPELALDTPRAPQVCDTYLFLNLLQVHDAPSRSQLCKGMAHVSSHTRIALHIFRSPLCLINRGPPTCWLVLYTELY